MNKKSEQESNSQPKTNSGLRFIGGLKHIVIVAILAFTTLAIVGIIYENPTVITFGVGGFTFSIWIGKRD